MRETTYSKTFSYRHLLARPSFYRFGFSIANWIPTPVLYSIADVLAEGTFVSGAETARSLCGNLRGAFPAMTERDISRLARKIFRNYARYLVDYGRYRSMSKDVLQQIFSHFEGEANIEAAFQPDRGVILVTGHIGNWELGGQYFGHRGVKINVVTLPDEVPQIDDIREEYRKANNIRTIVLDGSPFASLEMVAALRRGELVAMLIDRWGGKDGVPTDFFGETLYFPRGPFSLSRATGAVILPAFVVREEGAYKAIAEAPFVVEGEDDTPYAHCLGEVLERVIRRYPDQWYNFVPIWDSQGGNG